VRGQLHRTRHRAIHDRKTNLPWDSSKHCRRDRMLRTLSGFDRETRESGQARKWNQGEVLRRRLGSPWQLKSAKVNLISSDFGTWAVFRVTRQSYLFVFGLGCAVDADSSGNFVIYVQRDAAQRPCCAVSLLCVATRQLRKLQSEQWRLWSVRDVGREMNSDQRLCCEGRERILVAAQKGRSSRFFQRSSFRQRRIAWQGSNFVDDVDILAAGRSARHVPHAEIVPLTVAYCDNHIHLIVSCSSHGRGNDVLNIADCQGCRDQHLERICATTDRQDRVNRKEQNDDRQPTSAGVPLTGLIFFDHSLLRNLRKMTADSLQSEKTESPGTIQIQYTKGVGQSQAESPLP